MQRRARTRSRKGLHLLLLIFTGRIDMQGFRRIVTLIFALFGTGLLTHCATLPAPQAPRNENVAWDARSKTLTSVQTWNLQGLMAVRTHQDAFSATLKWQQQQQNYSILLLGPMGTNAVQLSGVIAGPAQLVTADGKKYSANSAEDLLTKQLGWHLPVSNLFYWVRGLPVPNVAASKQFDRYNHLTQLEQQGWRIQYLRYSAANHVDLPTKIFLDNPSINVKIVISQWML